MRRVRNVKESNFKLTEPVVLAFEHEIEDSRILRKYKKKKKSSFVVKFLRLIFLLAIIGAVVYLVVWYRNNSQNNKIIGELSNEYITIEKNENGETSTKVDFEGLLSKNEECIGWLVVPNTKISYPVVKHPNNDYYLAHSFDKSNNPAGWIFADYTNTGDGNDQNLVIYGHNRRDGSMFGTLNGVLKKSWYENEENRKVTYYTKDEKIEYEIFSIYNVPVEEYFAKTIFTNDLTYRNFLETVKERSIYDFGVSIDGCKSIITVSTCGATSESRTIIHARRATSKVTENATSENTTTNNTVNNKVTENKTVNNKTANNTVNNKTKK